MVSTSAQSGQGSSAVSVADCEGFAARLMDPKSGTSPFRPESCP